MAAWLEAIGLGAYRDRFIEEAVGLADLADLTESDLERLGLPMGPRKRVLRALRDARAGDGDVAPPAAEPTGVDTIMGSRAAVEGERRLVTILFADIADSTDLVQHLDAEAVSAIFDPLQRLLIDAVHRYGGTVNEVLGDGIMAIFGAPAAQEDHALRACHAAFDMQADTRSLVEARLAALAGRPIRLRVGVNSGEAVVRLLGNDLSVSYSAMGLTTHLAARMEQTAPPGTIRLTEDTARLVADFVEAVACAPVQVKGIDAPVAVFELRRLLPVRSRLEARAARGLTPFVGRQRELTRFVELFEEAASGRGHAVVIVAEPGLGKSRLLHELRENIGSRAAWSLGQCVSHGAASALHPIVDLLHRRFSIGEADQPEARRTRMDAVLAPIASELGPARHYLEFLAGAASDGVSLAVDPQIRRVDTFDAIIQFILRLAASEPQIVLLEDLHWSDHTTLEFLGRLVDAVPLSRVLLLATTRPDPALPNGGAILPARSYVTRMALGRLTREESAHLLAAVLGFSAVPEPLDDLVSAKAEGNPFFVEELVRSLVETGRVSRDGDAWQLGELVGDEAVPDTILQVLMSRIDRLGEGARRVLQVASVVGREFDRGLLAAVVDLPSTEVALRALQAAELVQSGPGGSDDVFVFQHALTQEVAYASLLARTRRELHRQIAAAIETRHAPHLADHHAVLGHHLQAAEDWPRAADQLEAAASRAADSAAVGDAVALLDRAIDCLERGEAASGERLAALHGRKAALLQIVSEVAGAHAAASRAVGPAQAASAAATEGMAWAQMGLASFYLHDFPRARDETRRAMTIGRRIGSAEITAAAGCALGWVEAVSGETRAARRRLSRAGAVAREGGFPAYEIIASALEAQLDHWQGHYERSLGRLRGRTMPALESRGQGEAPAFLFPHLLSLFSLGLPLAGKGAFDEAYGVYAEGLALAERVGDEIFRMRFLNSLGHVLAECGDHAAARPLNEQSRDLARARGDAEVIANAELNLADGYLADGDAALALEICEEVLGIVRSPTTSDFMRWRYAQHLFACMGETLLAADRPGRAADCADQCLDLAIRTASRKYLARGWRLKAATALARGDREAAETMLGKSVAAARSARSPGQLWRAELAFGAHLQETGRAAAARRRFAAAGKTLDLLHAGSTRPALKAAFRGSKVFGDAFAEAGSAWSPPTGVD